MAQKKKNPEIRTRSLRSRNLDSSLRSEIKSDFISLKEAVKYCDYTQEYLSLRARQGKLKAVKFARNWLTKKEWIQDYVREVEEYRRNQKKQIEVKPKLEKEPRFLERISISLSQISLPSKLKPAPALTLTLILLLLFSGIALSKESFKNVLQDTIFYVQQIPKTINHVLKETEKSLASTLDSLNQNFLNVAQVIQTTDYEDLKEPIPLFKEYLKWVGTNLKHQVLTFREGGERFIKQIKEGTLAFGQATKDFGSRTSDKLKKGWQFLVLEFQAERKELKEFIARLFKPRIVEKPPEKPVLVEVSREEFEKLKQEIKRIKEEGLPVKEVIKEVEVSRITKIEPIKEITKEIRVLDEKSLKIIRASLSEQETDLEKLKLAASLGYVRLPTILPVEGDTSITTLGTISTGTWEGDVITTTYGGSGADLSAGAQGGLVYMGASGIMGISAAGTSGYALISGGTGVPIWTNTPSWSTLTLSTSVTSPIYTGTGAVTLSSGGAEALTLDSASGTVQLATGDSLTVPGTITADGQLVATRAPTKAHTGTWSVGVGTWNADDATIYINPSTATGDSNLLGLAVNDSVKFAIDAEGDIFGNNLILEGSTSAGTTTIAGDLTVEGNTTLGDASTDTLTFNASTIAIPNNLNIDSDTLFIDASGNMVGIGTTGPDRKLDVLDASNPQLRLTQADGTVYSEFQTASGGSLTITTSATAGADDIVFSPAGAEKLRIEEDGDLFFEKGTNDVTLTVTAPTAPRTYTIPDWGADVSFVGTNRTISTTSPLSGGGDLSDNRTLTLAGLSSLGTGNYVVGVNSGATAWEYKNVVGTSDEVDIAHSAGQIQVGLIDPLITSKGGTGLSSYTAGDILYYSSGTVLSKLGIGIANKVLTSSGTAPQWSTNIAVGALPTGGNWDIISDLTIETDALFVGHADGSYPKRVGIGTTSPGGLLALQGNLNTALTGTVAATNGSDAIVGTGTNFDDGEIAVGDAIKIESDVAAGYEIFTVDAITDDTHLSVDSNYQGSTDSGLSAWSDPDLFNVATGDGSDLVTIDKSGNVGIGTTGPDRKLDIFDDTNPQLRLTYTDGSVYSEFQVNGSGNLIVSATGDVQFAPDGETEDYLTVSSDGTDLTLGTTDAANLTIDAAGILTIADATIFSSTVTLGSSAMNTDLASFFADYSTVKLNSPNPGVLEVSAGSVLINGRWRRNTSATSINLWEATYATGESAKNTCTNEGETCAGTNWFVYAVADNDAATTFTVVLSEKHDDWATGGYYDSSGSAPSGLTNYKLLGYFQQRPHLRHDSTTSAVTDNGTNEVKLAGHDWTYLYLGAESQLAANYHGAVIQPRWVKFTDSNGSYVREVERVHFDATDTILEYGGADIAFSGTITMIYSYGIIPNSVVTNDNLDGATLEAGVPLPGMVKVGDIAVDIYESTAWDTATDTIDEDLNDLTTNVLASKFNQKVGRNATQYDARRVALRTGKRLLTSAEWLRAISGTPDTENANPGEESGETYTGLGKGKYINQIWHTSYGVSGTSNDGDANHPYGSSYDTDADWGSDYSKILAGTAVNAFSQYNVYDGVGNIWEWTEDTRDMGEAYTGNAGWRDVDDTWFNWDGSINILPDTGNTTSDNQKYNYDGVYIYTDGSNTKTYCSGGYNCYIAALFRGGRWGLGARAGVFSVHLDSSPSYSYYSVGLRAAR